MPSTFTSRLEGLTTSVAVKAPCRVATTAVIALSGLQTIDGVALSAGDRVLVKNQSSTIDNGIWIASVGAWTRAADFDGTLDAVGGTQAMVISGSANGNTYWRVDGVGDVDIGQDGVTFEAALISDSATQTFLQSGTGADPRSVQSKLRERVTPEDFTAASDYARLVLAATEADAKGVPLEPGPDKVYDLGGSTWQAPRLLAHTGEFVFTNGTVQIRRTRDVVWGVVKDDADDGGTGGTIQISGVHYGNFRRLEAKTIKWDGGTEGAETAFGTFWCQFGTVKASTLFEIDTDLGSVNFNTTQMMRTVYAHITGGATPTIANFNQCGENYFLNWDITTSAGTDYGIVNDSTRAEFNYIGGLYADAGTGRNVEGNWHIIGPRYIDGSPIKAALRSHQIGSGDINSRQMFDVISAASSNLIRGGDWSIRKSSGLPISCTVTSGLALASVTNPPDHLDQYVGGVGDATFENVTFTVPRSFTGKASFVVFIYSPNGDLPPSVVTQQNGPSEFSVNTVWTDLGSDYYMARFSAPVRTDAAGYLRIYLETGSVVGREIYVGSVWATDLKAAIVPQKSADTVWEGSASWDPGSIADGDETATDITVTGTALGDFAQVSFSLDVTDLVVNASITASNTLTVVLANNTGAPVDLASGTVYYRVTKRV